MLNKLIKYDIKDKSKILIVFYILSIFFAILTRIFLSIDNSFIMNIIGKICSGTTIAMIFNVIINNVIRSWVRFKQNLYSDEAYLTHTLPIKKKTLYLSKFLSALISLFISTLVIVISLFIAYYSKENLEIVKKIIESIATLYDTNVLSIIVLIILILYLEIINMLQAGFSGIILGHKRNSNKMPFTFLYGFIVYLMTQAIVLIGAFITALFNSNIMNLFHTTTLIDVSTFKFVIYLAIMLYTLNVIILYFVNSHIFNKGVNID